MGLLVALGAPDGGVYCTYLLHLCNTATGEHPGWRAALLLGGHLSTHCSLGFKATLEDGLVHIHVGIWWSVGGQLVEDC